jgi:DNA invertase Pin-like site-specific DNA recombinase
LTLTEEIVDEGVSGKNSNREGYMRLLEIVRKGESIFEEELSVWFD